MPPWLSQHRRIAAVAAACVALLVAAIATFALRGPSDEAGRDDLRVLPRGSDSPTADATTTPEPSTDPLGTATPSAGAGEGPGPQPAPSTSGGPAEIAPLDAPAVDLDLSADGRVLAFTTRSAQVVPGDTNGGYDVFVRELATGRTVRASLDAEGHQIDGGMKSPFSVSLAADGNRVLFNDADGTLLVRDLGGQRTISVGHAAEPGTASLSADGRFVGFASRQDDVVEGDTNEEADAFVAELATGRVDRVSVSGDGAQGARPQSSSPGQTVTTSVHVSSGGQEVVFVSELTGLVAGPAEDYPRSYLYRHERDSGATERLDVALEASTSSDGRWVVYRHGGGTFVWDIGAGKREQVSRHSTVEAGLARISDDGRYVLDVDQSYHVRVLDRRSDGAREVGTGRDLSETAMSANGRVVAFVTNAADRKHTVGMVCQAGAACAVGTDP